MLWHKDEALGGAECVVLPGGFSYGDYLRCGAIARFSPIMKSVAQFAADGGLVIGICNGFQILVRGASAARRADAQSLALVHLRRIHVRVDNAQTPFTRADAPGRNPALCRSSMARAATSRRKPNSRRWKSADKCFCATSMPTARDSDAANPNGSMRSIAGVANDRFNVFGLMPHPEHAVEKMLGGADGLKIFRIDHRRARDERSAGRLPGEPDFDFERRLARTA